MKTEKWEIEAEFSRHPNDPIPQMEYQYQHPGKKECSNDCEKDGTATMPDEQ